MPSSRCIALVFPLLMACSAAPAASAQEETAATTASAQELKSTEISGTELAAAMEATSDKPRVYSFWASWCGPCIAELPDIREFAASRSDLDFILVNVDHPNVLKRKVLPLIRRHKLEAIEHLLLSEEDPAGALSRHIDNWPNQIPVHTFVGTDGKVLRSYPKAMSQKELSRAADKLLAP